MSMTSLVQELESQGRNGDTILAHINPQEAQLLKEHGGSGTINPETGIMEFNIFSDLWDGFKSAVKTLAPVIIPAVAIFVPAAIPAIGAYLGATGAMASVVGAAALSAGVTLAAGGNLKEVLTSAALAGASTYLTPIVGKALTFDGASQLSQIMAGSAAVGAGYTAMRGGSVKEMMAAAATGAASAYLGNLAKDSVAKMNNMMASGKVSGTITEKGATDATFLAADAANLKAAGLSESEIAATLRASGATGTAADYAASAVTRGMDASTLAANIAANSTGGVYSGAANTKALIAGNNIEMMQRVEDAQFLAEDAAQLRAQGLSQNDIKQNLMASGVSEQMASYAASKAVSGMTSDQLSNDLINQSSFLTSGKVYTDTTNTIARNIGEAMDAEQLKEYKALPFKDAVNAGQLTIDEASVLGQNGMTVSEFNKLTSLGYTASDLDGLISSGVTPQTLTTLANSQFPESQINNMLQSGVSANDISNASIQVANGKLSTQTAESLLKGGISGYNISSVATSGKADQIAQLFDKGMTEATYNKLASSGMDFNAINSSVDAGKLSANDLNWQVENNPSGYKNYINGQLVAAPVEPKPTQQTIASTQIANTGLVNSVDAQVLANSGYTASDVQNLVNLGYTGSELADMASTGVTANTLTTLASTPFPESTINDLLTTGHSANEISKASFAVSNKGVTLDSATQLMNKGVNGADIYNMSFGKPGSVDLALQMANQGVDAATIKAIYNSGANMSSVIEGLNDGRLVANDVNSKVAAGGKWGDYIDQRLSQPVQPSGTGTATGTGTGPVSPSSQISDLANSIVQQYPNINPSQVQEFLDNGYSIQQISAAAANNSSGTWAQALSQQWPGAQPVQPTPGQTAQGPVTPGTVTDSGASVEIGGAPKYAGYQNAGTPPSGFEVATPTDVFGPTDTNSAQNPYTQGTYLDAATNTWFKPVASTPYVPVVTPPVTPTTPTPPTPTTVTPPAPPVQPTVTNSQIAQQIAQQTGTNVANLPKIEQYLNQGYTSESIANSIQTSPAQWEYVLTGQRPVETPVVVPPTPIVPTTPVTPPTTTPVTPPVVTPPAAPTVVSSSTRTTSDGSVYRDNQMSDGTTTSTLVSGPTVTPPTTQPPLSPIQQEVIPPGSSYVAPVEVTPPPTTTTPTETTPPVDPNPYIPIVTPQPPILPNIDDYRGKYTLGQPIRPNIPNTLNPGWITNVPDFYKTTNDAQSKYYWGGHPYQTGTTFNPTLYNQVPNAPVSPFGLGYAQRAASAQDIMGAMKNMYPLLSTTTVAPVQPTINTQ